MISNEIAVSAIIIVMIVVGFTILVVAGYEVEINMLIILTKTGHGGRGLSASSIRTKKQITAAAAIVNPGKSNVDW